MMKKIAVLVLTAGLFFIGANQVAAVGGPLPDADSPFWDVMSQINTPDDATCANKAETILTAAGDPTANADAASMCAGISGIVTTMEPEMTASGISTNLFAAADWHHVQNLYFAAPQGKIEFSNEINFMSRDFMAFLSDFTDRMSMSQGEIGLDADIVGGLAGYGAVLTMYNAGDFTDPEILVDGATDSEDVVSGLNYNLTTHDITFDAAHFTTFKASERDNDDSDHKPRIDDIDIEKYKTSAGVAMVKITLEGKHFKKSTDAMLGGKDASKTTYKSSKKIVATFKVKSLLKAGKKELKLKAFNGNKMGKYHKELLLSSLL